MNDKENLDNNLIEANLIPKSQKCCVFVCFENMFRFFTCKKKEIKTRQYYINKWRKYLLKEVDSKKELNDPFRMLTNLWAHKNVIKDLEQIRLNPNLLNKNKIRNDLEFYIPQLCTFMLFGEYETVEEFLAFLCKACYASFSFAHRILWFLKSLLNPMNPYNEKIRNILHLIQTIFKSENKNGILERLHVAGSKGFIEYLGKKGLLEIYYNKAISSENSDPATELKNRSFLDKKFAIRENIDKFIDMQYNQELSLKSVFPSVFQEIPEQSAEKNNISLKLQSEDVFMNIFFRYDSVTNDEDNISTQYVKQIDPDDINLSSFLSNINFIDHMCNICDILRYTTVHEQRRTLLNEIKKVNKMLPANVYLPFSTECIRNYVIASIPLSEVKIFTTKSRAPYMITVECFRLDELNFTLKVNLVNELSSVCTTENKDTLDEEEDKYKLNSDIYSHNKKPGQKLSDYISKDDFCLVKHQATGGLVDSFFAQISGSSKSTKTRKNSALHDEKKKVIPKKHSDCYVKIQDPIDNNPKAIELSSLQKPKDLMGEPEQEIVRKKSTEMIRTHHQKFEYLLESDVKISKPVLIKNLLRGQNSADIESESSSSSQKKKSVFSRNKSVKKKKYKQLIDEDFDYETDPEDYKKIDQVVKINVNKKNVNLSDDTFNRESTSPEAEASLEKENPGSQGKKKEAKNHNSVLNEDGIILSPTIEKPSVSPNVSDLSDIEESKDSEAIEKDIRQNEGEDVFFGEKLETQTERLRKLSPFGNFNTYKLFKVIVKSGEDLRQEQFATQLINEFSQIFKFEKVDCWVNPYEIIATGNNVGIIEVVPNAISIDQLKQKEKNVSTLKAFYESYFGSIKSKRYKSAMKNFISSLAGYSLVCYFLQIKDRHNANILIDDKGHLIHIDFGYMLSNSPGKGITFEKAPFKLTSEFVDVMGGVKSKYFSKFRKLLWKGFLAVVKHSEKILILVEMMFCGHGSKLPCFEREQNAINELKSRFMPRPKMKARDYIKHVDFLIEQSIDNWRTKWYDKYQYWVQGIFY